MSRARLLLALSIAALAVAILLPIAGPALATRLPGGLRGDLLVPGAATTLSCTTGASAATSALENPANYWVRCQTDTYFRSGTSSPTAAAGDFVLPANAIVKVGTDNGNYFACKSVAVNGTCYLIEAR